MKKAISLLLSLTLCAGLLCPAALAAEAEGTFDPTLTIEQTDSVIRVTMNPLPAGKTATLTINCGSWTAVEVYDEAGEPVRSTLADGQVSFQTSGGTYTIQNVTPAPVVRPSRPTTTTKTVEKEDGSVTTTVTNNRTGAVTETTVTPDGTTAKTSVAADGVIQAQVSLSDTAGETGESVTLPIPPLPVTESGETPSTVTVAAAGQGPVRVVIPTVDASVGTVAVLLHADGTEEVVCKCVTTEAGVVVPVADGDTLKLVDNTKAFDDVDADEWYSDAVIFSSSRELFTGTSATTFSPGTPMTRGMLATVLHNLESRPDGVGDSFTDVDDSRYYAAGIAWAAGLGIVSGYGDGTFGPEDDLTREQLAIMLYRYERAVNGGGFQDEWSFALDFVDADQASEYAREALCWMVQKGIINGKGDGILDPLGKATRAEVAQVLLSYQQAWIK